MKKVLITALICGSLGSIALTTNNQEAEAAGCSGWVTYSVGSPYCKYVTYSFGVKKPFTYQNYYQKRTCVNNAGKTTVTYQTVTKSLGAGCR